MVNQFQLSSHSADSSNDRRRRTSTLPENYRSFREERNQHFNLNLEQQQQQQPPQNLQVVTDESDSDAESCCTSAFSPRPIGMFDTAELVPLDENEPTFGTIKQKFMDGLRLMENHATVVAIHQISLSSLSSKARIQTLRAQANAMEKRRNGNANIHFAWYGVSKEKVNEISNHGFSRRDVAEGRNRVYGHGIALTPFNCSLNSLASAAKDEDGLRHVLLCRVVLGNLEEIPRGCAIDGPSSAEFDSGVDSLLNPKKYTVWSSNMNTHILVANVVTIKTTAQLDAFIRSPGTFKKPTSPWMSFPELIAMLSRYLPPQRTHIIERFHRDFRANKLTRQEMVQVIRRYAGDRLISAVVKSHRAKQQQKKKQIGGSCRSRVRLNK